MRNSIILLAALFALMSCSSNHKTQTNKSEVEIFDLTWSTENLNKVVLNNGDSLLKCHDASEWVAAHNSRTPAFMYYNFNDSLGALNRAMYNAYAVRAGGGLAPSGWHIPTDIEVRLLERLGKHAQFTLRSAGNLKEGTGLWREPINYDLWDHLLDSTGFHAIPSGEAFMHANPDAINFGGLNSVVTYWTSTPIKNDPERLSSWFLMQNQGRNMQVNYGTSRTGGSAFYVRCVKDR